MSDRGYRDEVGAAVERLEKLEEENLALRAELDRLDGPKRRARALWTGVRIVLFGAVIGSAIGTFMHGPCPHRHHRSSIRRHAFAPQRTQLDAKSRARAGEERAQPVIDRRGEW